MPDERLGERACAFVVGREGSGDVLDLRAARDYLAGLGVARQYWPERIEPIESLPRNASGKVQKFLLRERAQGLTPSTHKEPVR
jgi:cyclohexanecarboxylate-CoA ligase